MSSPDQPAPPDQPTTGRRLLRSSGGTGLLKLAQALTGIATTIVLARVLGPDSFGIYAFGLAVVTILAIPAKNGLGELTVREMAHGMAQQDWPHVAGVLRWLNRLTLAYVTVSIVLIGGGAWVWTTKPPLAAAIPASMWLLPGMAFMGLASGSVRALGKPFLALLPDSVLRPTLLVAFLGAGLLVAPAWMADPYVAFYLHALAAALCTLFLWVLVRRDLPAEVRDATPARVGGWHWFKVAFAFSALGGLMVLNRQIDLLILGLINGERDAGLYRVAIQGGMLITFGSQAVTVVISPMLARNRHAEGHAERWILTRLSVIISGAVALPALAVMIIFGQPLLALLFGDAFRPAYPALVILSLANALSILNGAIVPLLNMTGHENSAMKSFGAAVVTNAVLSVVLVLAFGLVGAAYAALGATLVWTLILRSASIRHLDIDPFATLFRKNPHVR